MTRIQLLSILFLFFSSLVSVTVAQADPDDPGDTTDNSTSVLRPFGFACSQANQKLAHGTYQLSSGCGSKFFCADNNTCANKGCRRDDYPFGYMQNDTNIPPKCDKHQFCPDEQDACQDLLPVNSLCQLNRDGTFLPHTCYHYYPQWITRCSNSSALRADQCEPPPNANELAGPRNWNGAVCLNFLCL